MIKSVAKKTLIGTLGAASLFVAGTSVAHADTTTINAGDSVWAYSQKYHVSIDSIVKANKLADANLIVAGQTINIPGVKTADFSATSTVASSATATSAVASSAIASSATATSAVASSAVASSATASSVVASSAVASSAVATSTSTVASSVSSAATSNSTAVNTGSQNSAAASNTATSVAPASSAAAKASTVTNVNRNGGVAAALAIANGNTPYVYSGNTMSGFDCSGFVQYVYGTSARTAAQQSKLGAHHYDVQNAPYGALLFWGSESAPYHVAISLGNGTYVAAQNSRKGIGTFSQTYWKPAFYVNY